MTRARCMLGVSILMDNLAC
ncbi:hypothetical protein MC885_009207 [Smutsia gigantea]|nr:hypothetical protein MC885_009207 [Smutsia gigantea]